MIDIESLWDYNDPVGSEERFNKAMLDAPGVELLLELKTQLARTHSLRREFDEAHSLLDQARDEGIAAYPRAQIRYLLERGRTYNSSGRKNDAVPLFLEAYELGSEVGEEFLAADAAHMMAIVTSGEDSIEWNLRTIAIAKQSSDAKAKKWIASAGNNLGWSYHELGRFREALKQFEAVQEIRKAGARKEYLIARWCVARTLRSLGRLDEALFVQRELEREWSERQEPSGFVFEEIAECLHALGKLTEAQPYFAKAFDLLSQDQWIAADEPERLERLKRLSNSCGGRPIKM